MPEGADQSFSEVGLREKDTMPLPGDPSALEDRIIDLDKQEASPFLRGQKRIPVRRGPFQKGAASRLRFALLALGVCVLAGAAASLVFNYGRASWRFRIESSDAIEIAGIKNATRAQVLAVMGGDIGRNVFFIPLDERKRQLEKISWVESATVMRLLPNRLKIVIRERTPVAFTRVGDRIELIDAHGVNMEMPADANFSFPVITGNTETEPLSTRAARMKAYFQLIRALDANGANYSRDLDEVDLSDPEDIKVTVADQKGPLLIHLGAENYLERFTFYKTHIQEWRQQSVHLQAVDLRYERQVVLVPEISSPAEPALEQAPPPTASQPDKPKAGLPGTQPSAGRSRKDKGKR
jgi:cell division protein FtsQ